MAVTVDQANIGTMATSANSVSTKATTAAVAVGATIVVVTFSFHGGTATASHTMSGGGLTWVRDHTLASGTIRAAIHHAEAPAGLASGTNITLTVIGNGDMTWCMGSYLGGDFSSILAFNGTSASTAAWSSGTLTGSVAGGAVIGGAGSDGSLLTSVVAGDNNERIDFNSATTSGSVTLYDDLNSETTDTVAGTWSGAQAHLGVGIAIAASGGAPAEVIPSLVMPPLMS